MSATLRSGRLVVLAGWSACLAWLWASGEVARYLGPRTFWVVPFGAITLAGTTLAYAHFSRDTADARKRLGLAEAAGLIALLAPILIVFTMAHAALGSLAASRKLTSRGVDVTKLAGRLTAHSDTASFLELKTAEKDPGFAAQSGIEPGRTITLRGFVMKQAKSDAAPFQLARFYITCCVADSVPIPVDVYPSVPLPSYGRDTWLDVTGVIRRRGQTLVVAAERVIRTSQPHNPYLTFRY